MLLPALVVAATFARLLLLAARPLWYDEIFTVWAARLAPRQLLDVLRLDSGPPLFYWLTRPLVLIAERLPLPDAFARVLSFAAAACIFAAARILPDGAARRRYTLLAAASPLLLLYAAEARPYALLALEGMGVFLLALRGVERLRRLAWTALLCAAALYTHYLALFLLAALGAVALARGRRRSAAAVAVGALVFMPWIPILARQPAAATAWMREPVASSLSGFLSALGGAGRTPSPLGDPLPSPVFWAGAVVGLLALVGFASAPPGAREARDAAAVTLLTLGGVLAASALRPAAFPGRSELVVLPIWLWGIAAAGATSRLARAACAAAVVTGAVSCALLVSAPRGTPLYSERLAQVVALARPADLLVAGGVFYLPARLAADRGELHARLIGTPAELEEHPGWIPAALASPADLARLEREVSTLAPEAKTYVLLPSLLATPGLREALARHRRLRVLTEDSGTVLLILEGESRQPSQ